MDSKPHLTLTSALGMVEITMSDGVNSMSLRLGPSAIEALIHELQEVVHPTPTITIGQVMWADSLDKAELVEHDGWVWSNDVRGSSDGYFQSVEELAEYVFDDESDIPEFAFACTSKALVVDICDILERLDDLGWEEMTEHAVGVDELSDAIDKFNEANKETFTVYEADYTKKVRVVR